MILSSYMCMCIIATRSVSSLFTACSASSGSTSASIVCHFPHDLRQTDVGGVHVQRYSFNESDPRAVSVVDCYRGELADKSFTCGVPTAGHGYSFTGSVSKNFTVNIENMTENKAGIYRCSVSPRNRNSPYVRANPMPCQLRYEACRPPPNCSQTPPTDTTSDNWKHSQHILISTAVLLVIAACVWSYCLVSRFGLPKCTIHPCAQGKQWKWISSICGRYKPGEPTYTDNTPSNTALNVNNGGMTGDRSCNLRISESESDESENGKPFVRYERKRIPLRRSRRQEREENDDNGTGGEFVRSQGRATYPTAKSDQHPGRKRTHKKKNKNN